ncbi:MAG: hypothetical protein V9G10_13935 [Candidatus Nanopelagicales bacterium]
MMRLVQHKRELAIAKALHHRGGLGVQPCDWILLAGVLVERGQRLVGKHRDVRHQFPVIGDRHRTGLLPQLQPLRLDGRVRHEHQDLPAQLLPDQAA